MLDNLYNITSIVSSQKSNNTTNKQKFQNLQLIKLAVFKNNQLNGIFNDNTTIILHPCFGNISTKYSVH